ncbi:MAG: helix-turn-helix transcriptional regulator [Chloroflexi bacterium]|nr:helix-turn-helix transcriptional regulator [Chloroflexota bacterium]
MTRKQQIARMVAMGETNHAIAYKLGISRHTVKNHLDQLRLELGSSGRAMIAAWAAFQGLVKRDEICKR